MTGFMTILRREIAAGYGFGGYQGHSTIWLPILFFIAALVIYPFAIGPDLPLI